MSRFREFLTVILIALLPFHALFVTFGTKLLKGPGNAPWSVLAVWKEAFLALILLIAIYEIWDRSRGSTKKWKEVLEFDAIDTIIVSIGFLAVLVSWLTDVQLGSFVLGIRYDVLPLAAFFILRRVEWSPAFIKNITKTMLSIGGIIAAFALISLVLPASVFTALGYSDLHSLYIANGPLAPFQMIGGSALRRAQSTMSGPNQLGLWLLLPWSFAVLAFWRKVRTSTISFSSVLLPVLVGAAIVASFSRSAWIAATVIAIVAAVIILPKNIAKKILTGFAVFCVAGIVFLTLVRPDIIIRKNSSEGHVNKPIEAWNAMWNYPWGQGLGSAGPANNRVSDTCVELDAGADASWATAHQNLCVFVGGKQVQPVDRACDCPILPENWYLQFGVELGVTGFVLSLLLPVLVLFMLWEKRKILPSGTAGLALGSGLAFLGVSIAAMLLHAWEDAGVAFTVWILLAVVLGREVNTSFVEKVLSLLKRR